MKHASRLLGVVAAVALLGGSLAVGEEAEKTCLKCRTKMFVKAMRSGNADQVRSYLAADYVFRDATSGTTLDRAGIEQILEWDLVVGSAVSYENLEWVGDTVTGEFTETSSFYELLELEPRRYRMSFRYRDDRIAEQVVEPLPQSGPSFDDALQPFLDWARTAHADELSEIYPDSEFVFTAAAARRWLSLLETWRSETSRS